MSDEDKAATGGPPEGKAAMLEASKGDPSPGTAFNALAYFMGDEPPPGIDDSIPFRLDFGRGDGQLVAVTCRSLELEEMDRCTKLARDAIDKHPEMGDLGIGFIRWSYIFAYACQEPNLGQALTARRAKAQAEGDEELLKQLVDTAALVRLVFRKRAGVLQNVAFKIEEKAKLGDAGASSVSIAEVEAGKASS